MDTIISKLYNLIHQTGNLIELEESVRLFMYDILANAMGKVFKKSHEVKLSASATMLLGTMTMVYLSAWLFVKIKTLIRQS